MTMIDLSPDELCVIERIRGKRAHDARRMKLVADIAQRAANYARQLEESGEPPSVESYSKALPLADWAYTSLEYNVVHEFWLSADDLAETFA